MSNLDALLAEAPPENRTVSSLETDPTCGNRTNWRTWVLPGPPAPEVLVEVAERRLASRGWRVRCHHPRLRVFRRPDGEEIAWVLASGRVQIRVPLWVETPGRRAFAGRVWHELACALAD